jgi:hypothetical protein
MLAFVRALFNYEIDPSAAGGRRMRPKGTYVWLVFDVKHVRVSGQKFQKIVSDEAVTASLLWQPLGPRLGLRATYTP